MEIGTTQNVNLTSEKAGIGERFLALIIDFSILAGISIALALIFRNSGIIDYVFILLGFMFVFYHFLFELFYNGKSFGKNIVNIRIVAINGEKAGFYQYLIRNLLRPIDYIFGLGLVFMVFNSKGQRLGDISAGTYAIKLNKVTDYKDTVFIDLDENYKPLLERYQLEHLNPQHIELIKTVIADSKKQLRYESVEKIYHKVCSIIDVEQNELTRLNFLEMVIKDFNYYQL